MSYGGPSNETFANIFSAIQNLKYFHCEIEITVLRNYTFRAFKSAPLTYLRITGRLRVIEIHSFLPLRFLSSLVIADHFFLKLSNTLPDLHVFDQQFPKIWRIHYNS